MAVPRLAETATGSGHSKGLPGNPGARALRHCSLSTRRRVRASTARAMSPRVLRRRVSGHATPVSDASSDEEVRVPSGGRTGECVPYDRG